MINLLKSKESKSLSSSEVYIELTKLIQDQIDLSLRISQSEDSFEKASWSEYQAYQLGMQKAYQKVLSFLPDPVTKIDN